MQRITCPSCGRHHRIDRDDPPGLIACDCGAELVTMNVMTMPARRRLDVSDQIRQTPKEKPR